MNLRRISVCATVSLLLSLVAVAQSTSFEGVPLSVSNDVNSTPTTPITLYSVNGQTPMARFTVAHQHGYGFCFGYLDMTPDAVTFHSFTQSNDSFSVRRSAVQEMKVSWSIYASMSIGKKWNFIPVTPTVAAGGDPSFNNARRGEMYSPGAFVDFWQNFESNWNTQWTQLHPVPITPAEPPKPTVAALKIVSSPGGAQVYVDGVFKGETSDNGDLVIESSPGDHALRLRRTDYKEWNGTVTLAGQRTEQKIELVKRGPDPLSVDEIDQALSQGMTPARLSDLVKQYGVNFEVTDDVEKKLRDKGADSDLLLVIAKNKR